MAFDAGRQSVRCGASGAERLLWSASEKPCHCFPGRLDPLPLPNQWDSNEILEWDTSMRFSAIRSLLRATLFSLLLGIPLWGLPQDSPPVIPGLQQRHALGEVAQGQVLLDELRCAACHVGMGTRAAALPSPNLSDVGRRISPDYMQRFIADPAGVQPGTKMPGMLSSLEPDELRRVSTAITHFLVDTSGRTWSQGEPESERLDEGSDLFHRVGCIACHAPFRPPVDAGAATDLPEEGRVGLAHVPAKYSLDSLSEFLFQPGLVREAGRMPDMGLNRQEARDIAGFLMGSASPSVLRLEPDQELVGLGRRFFSEFGCASCHALPGIEPIPAKTSLEDFDAQGGCLSESSSDSPRYQLSQQQANLMTQAMAYPSPELSDTDAIAHSLTALNCIACHVRDDYGGVSPDINAYFETSEHDLGDEARIPPALTLTGAKLQGEWMRKVLFDYGSVRPYMHTRMPQFGSSNVAHLPALFEQVDAGGIEPFELPQYTNEERNLAKQAGRELVGFRILNCVACHDFNGTPSPIHEGVDLVNSPERLQYSWFARFLIDPQGYRPGVVMPESWSGGEASYTRLLEGDTSAQIAAIWTYLSDGRTARDPEGIQPAPLQLQVTDTTRTYRGRSRVAGFRGIAVGYPSGLSYAFNADTGTLSALWNGDFLSVRWDGQGAGDFNVRSRNVVQLAQDMSFYALPDTETPWPLRPHMDEDHPVNPDPLYPRKYGYQFRGYHLDGNSVPTLRYSYGEVSIEDRSAAEITEERSSLRRSLRFNAPAASHFYFRALTGEIEVVDATHYRISGLQVTIPDVPVLLRNLDATGSRRELLLDLSLPSGNSDLEVSYELLD
ncbi:MAG: mono/diheme cytochrome c family protein [Planctomycetota bacterium]|jgi:mono/diheme cytochrome c family protein